MKPGVVKYNEQYGRLTPILNLGSIKGAITWKCKCVCGTEVRVRASHLVSGEVRSCGCLNRDVARETHTTHNMSYSSEYSAWDSMKQRCLNIRNPRYKSYGGRGIIVCERWLSSFENFYEDMGPCLSGKHSLDRINNEGNYEPGNCRWATVSEQNRNRRFSWTRKKK